MEGENRLRGDPAARSRSAAQAEEAGRKPCLGERRGKAPRPPHKPRLRRHEAFARGMVTGRAETPRAARGRCKAPEYSPTPWGRAKSLTDTGPFQGRSADSPIKDFWKGTGRYGWAIVAMSKASNSSAATTT